MPAPETLEDAPTTARFHRQAIEQIVQCVEERVFCALLGPRMSGKTILLRFIERQIAGLLGWTCAYIDLLDLRASTQAAFFSDLIQQTAARLSHHTSRDLPLPDERTASSAVFRAFLSDCLDIIGRDVVLIIDPLEALPADLLQALLTSLRAAYMDQQNMDYQVTVVASGALSLATVAVGESSPFRGIARRVFVGDLSRGDSQDMILELLAEYSLSATKPALQKLLAATSGDLYLIRRLTHHCAELVSRRSSNQLRSRDITLIIDRFLQEEVFQYAPLLEAVRLIEEDPDLLECILRLLSKESVLRSDLPLPLSPDLDPLYLTGVVEAVDGDCYRLQNLIYRRFLATHFSPGRVGHVLAMVGRWDSAIDYLEASLLQGNPQSRADLLPATINSMYAAQDLAQAVHFMRRGLSAAFDINDTSIWFSPPQERHLQLLRPAGLNPENEALNDLHIDLEADRLEARAYRQRVPLRGQEGERRVVRAIPLLVPGGKPVGVVTLYDHLGRDTVTELRERDLQLAGFLTQAARALQAVNSRRQELSLAGRVQASLLPEVPERLPGWEISAAWHPARETSGDFYDFVSLPGGRLGIVIADVVDKGMGAALLMTLSRTLIRTYAAGLPDHPDQLMNVVNQRIISDLDAGLFVTLFYGVLDPITGRLAYSNAGHPPPYLFTPEEPNGVTPLHRTGMPLGISDESDWTAGVIQVPVGGCLLLYTDGLPEAQNSPGDLFGHERMLDLVQAHFSQPTQAIQDTLVSAVYAFSGAAPQADDITVVLLTRVSKVVPPLGAERRIGPALRGQGGTA